MDNLDQRLKTTSDEIRMAAAGLTRPLESPRGRRLGWRGAVATAFAAMLLIGGTAMWLGGTATNSPRDVAAQPPSVSVPAAGADTTAPEEAGGTGTSVVATAGSVVLGEPVANAIPGEVREFATDGDTLYASTAGPTDRVMRSIDGGSTWETVLEAEIGDSEGLFGVGEVVILVIEDDDPARNTVEPASVVTDALNVFVFDPTTGATTEAALPRPDDPTMRGLSLAGETDGCALGGYQSWILANGVAVGDRIVVTGAQQLVGELEDGTVFCDGQVFRHLTWTSDDKGATWTLHDGMPISTISWTGERFVAWSNDSAEDRAPTLVISDDGIDWVPVAPSPAMPDGAFPVQGGISVEGDKVIAWTGIHRWTLELPDEITTPEQLDDVLQVMGMDSAQVMQMIGVDLPLDDAEIETIARFVAHSEADGAIIAVSTDRGVTWAVSYSDVAVGSAGIVGDTFLATAAETPSSGAATDTSSLLSSPDGISWEHSIDLPGMALTSGIASTDDALFVLGRWPALSLLRIPVG